MRSPLFLLVAGLAFIIVAVGAWMYFQPEQAADGSRSANLLPFQGPSTSSNTPQNTAISGGTVNRNDATAPPAQTPAQIHEEIAVRNSEPPLLEPVPNATTPTDIDDYILRQLRGPLENPEAAQLLSQDAIIDRSNTVFVNLAKGQIARNHLPITPAGGKFLVNQTDHAETFTLSADNAQRYTPYVNAMEKFDVRKLAALYRALSPQLENAYRQLGEPGSFHDAMTTAFDLILATPEIDDAQITLVRPKVMYQYQAPELEKLAPIQKLMLRIGSDNRQRVKRIVAQWRAQLRP